MFAHLKDYKLNYSLIESRKKPLVLLLHGFMGNSDDFTEVISLLSENFCCLAVDLPGHGKTTVMGDDECYTMSKTAEILITLLDYLEIRHCFLFGYSMGGRLALYMSLHFPSRFEKVILESASPGLKTQEERSRRLQADCELAQQLSTRDLKTFLLNWYDRPLFKSLQNHPNFDQLIEQRLQNNPLELAKSLLHMGTGNQPSLWDKLAENKNPLLLLVGEYDDKFSAINNKMASLCSLAQLEIVPRTGHNISFENKAEWVKNVIQFCLLPVS